LPTEGNFTEYRSGDTLIGNIRPNLGKIWHADRVGGTNGDVLVIHPINEVINPRYLYQVLTDEKFFGYNMQHAKGAKMPRGNKAKIMEYSIPIPCPNTQKNHSKSKQKSSDLDTFTELTTELSARKKQYNYYRDQLLSFEEGEVEWKSLSEVAEYSKMRINFEELDEANYVGVENLLQNRLGKTESSRVPEKGNLTQYSEQDILIGNIRPYLKKIWHADRIGGTNGDVLVIHTTDNAVNPRYLYQVLADDTFFEYNMQHAKGAKMPRGNKAKIMEYPIPIPYPNDPEKSLAEQERIVSILDKFDTLTNSISEGLPREIELRQKQYEYYRDLLLSFPKAEAVA